jgi:hypothetical protein
MFWDARWPGFARLNRGAFHLTDRHHLARVRFAEFTPAGRTAKRSDVGEIFARSFVQIPFRHPQIMHRKPLMIRENKSENSPQRRFCRRLGEATDFKKNGRMAELLAEG